MRFARMLMCGSVAVGASERPVLLAGHAIVMTIKLASVMQNPIHKP